MTASEPIIVRLSGISDTGLVREHNEDSFLIVDLGSGTTELSLLRQCPLGERGTLMLVCDGMGGAAAGEVASNMAVEGMRRALLGRMGIVAEPQEPEPPGSPDSPRSHESPESPAPAPSAHGEGAPPTDAPATDVTAGAATGADEAGAAKTATAPAEATEPTVPAADSAQRREPEPLQPGISGAAGTAPLIDSPPVPPVLDPIEATTPAVLRVAHELRDAVMAVNLEIFEAACADLAKAGMGTTLTALWLRRGRAMIAQVGDSRAYIWRGGKLTQVTHDQSLVNQLLDSGQITPDQAKLFEHSNVILQALGVQEDVEVLISTEELRQGDRILLCSDGLVGVVGDEEIQEVMGLSDDLDAVAQTLVDMARAAGGPDNITVLCAQVSGGLPAPRPGEPGDEVLYRPILLDPPPRLSRDYDVPHERIAARISGRILAGRRPPQRPGRQGPPLSMAAVLSMAWVVGLLVAGLVIAILLYPWSFGGLSPRVRGVMAQRGARCFLLTDPPGLEILVDGQRTGQVATPAAEIELTPGDHRIALGPGPRRLRLAWSGEQEIHVSPGQRCAVKLRPLLLDPPETTETPAQPNEPSGGNKNKKDEN